MQGRKKKIWSIALALLLITGLSASQSVLFAKDTTEENTEQEYSTQESSTESEKQDVEETTEKVENKEQSLKLPKIGGGQQERTFRKYQIKMI